MPLLTQRILRGLKPASFNDSRPPADRATPERIVLGVREGLRPSSQPPVRIYLGTERGQFRAERIFIWSVEKHRDPSRIYEIYLMRDLKGFGRRFWLTGFTNYRFAIPEFAGYNGRAIYNDTDQIYLRDPALLFDTPMDQAGFLSINDRDTSVMLIDCKRMSEVWNGHDVRRLSRKALEARARQQSLWGKLDGGWNARDSEYDPARSHLVHFTTLHTQPWRPFPDEFVYFDNPTDPLWHDLEAEADNQAFLPVTASRPSARWAAAAARLPDSSLRGLLGPQVPERLSRPLQVRHALERLPDEDLPWVLERLFSLSDTLEIDIVEPRRHGDGQTRRSLWFWQQQLALAGRLHPETRWQLLHRRPGCRPTEFHGGPAPAQGVVILTHRKPGHNNQARAIGMRLAQDTGLPAREVPIPCSEAEYLGRRLLGRSALPELQDPNAIVVAGGWLGCRVARALQQRQPGLRLILSGRKAGPAEAMGSVLVQCRHFGLPSHPNRLTTVLPLNSGQVGATQAEGSARWSDWLAAPKRIALLVGGSSRSHVLAPDEARRMLVQIKARAKETQAALLVVTSRRSLPLIDLLRHELGQDGLLYRWQADDPDNPYRLALDRADELVVTGESESMLADAASRGRGFWIWPVPSGRQGLWARWSAGIAARAVRPRFNRRGSIRPQQGQTYLCARALERGWVLPPRDIESLHQNLYAMGTATTFGQTLPQIFAGPTDELTATVRAAADRLGLAHQPQSSTTSSQQEAHERRADHS